MRIVFEVARKLKPSELSVIQLFSHLGVFTFLFFFKFRNKVCLWTEVSRIMTDFEMVFFYLFILSPTFLTFLLLSCLL